VALAGDGQAIVKLFFLFCIFVFFLMREFLGFLPIYKASYPFADKLINENHRIWYLGTPAKESPSPSTARTRFNWHPAKVLFVGT